MSNQNYQEVAEKKDNRILDGLHYYLCSRDYNINFDESIDNINLNVEGDDENKNSDLNNLIPEETADKNAEQPEQSNIQQQPQMSFTNLANIPLSFNDPEDYVKTFEQHLFSEAKAQIIKAQVTESRPPEIMRLKNSQVIALKNNQELFFRKLTMEKVVDSETKYGTHDFIVISLQDPSKAISGEHMLGVVERAEGNEILVKVVFDENSSEPRNQKILKVMQQDESVWRNWYVKKFCSIVTIQREYEALHNFNDLLLKEFILNPEKLAQKKEEKFLIPEQLQIRLNQIYNPSQIQAINSTLKKQGVTLIQGPPGTGKTRTVLGTVSVLINSFNQDQLKQKHQMEIEDKSKLVEQSGEFHFQLAMPWMQPNYVDWRDSTFDHLHNDFSNFTKTKKYITADQTDKVIPILKAQEEHAPPEKILICGPSNAAIDEIVRKMKKEGLLDKNGNIYDPSKIIVRIGENYDKDLEDVSLDFLVKQKLGEQNIRSEDAQEIRKKILKEAKIICGTLSSTGSQILASANFKFDTVVVDEAAQSTEISTLIPLQYQCTRLILIGDHNQLPATIFSKKCEKFNYHQSLFERFEKCKVEVHMLNQQYRMNPIISKFISQTFYQEKISDAEKINELVGQPEIYQLRLFQPVVFFNIEGNEIFEKSSYKNEEESKAIVEIYNKLRTTFPNFDLNNLGIITAYSRQVKEIEKKIKAHDKTDKCMVEVHTVDGFQGREKDIIIFSTVRASQVNGEKNTKKTIGFLNDKRRMNVSLSRARLCVIVVGDLKQLKFSKLWKGLADYAIEQKSCYNMQSPYQTFVSKLELHFDQYKIYRSTQQ
ncbi:hypothetical protein ABPG72_009867 [Tetrahymena utriculariae]